MTIKGLLGAAVEAAPARPVMFQTNLVDAGISADVPGSFVGGLHGGGFDPLIGPVPAESGMIEIPFMAATTLDSVVADPGDRAVQQNRRSIREAFGLPEVKRYSIGPKGSFSLDPTAVLLVFVARARWSNREIVSSFNTIFQRCGLAEVVRSDAYAACVSNTVERVRAECRGRFTGDFGPGLVNSIALDQLNADNSLREVAACFSKALGLLADTRAEVERIPGHVVRIDGPEALIVVETPERHELHRIDSNYLERFGLKHAGSAFVLHRQKWTPDTTVGIYVPAVRSHNFVDLPETTLRAAEKPLPAL